MGRYNLTLLFFLMFLVCGFAHDDLQSACKATLEPQFCMSMLMSFEESWDGGFRDLARIALNVSIDEARKVIELIAQLGQDAFNHKELVALKDCKELLDITLDTLEKSMPKVTGSTSNSWGWRQSVDVQTWLSAAIANQVTCLEGFEETSGRLQTALSNCLPNVTRLVSNCLALIKKISVVGGHYRRRLLSDLPKKDGFPFWLSSADRRRLVENDGVLGDEMVTVAGDGSGDHTTITEALNAAPNNSLGGYVIYVKKGVYEEYVEIPSWKTNIMLVGDGINVTIITGNRNVVDGWTTYHSATLAVVGVGFLARGITFENRAGPEKLQAVALRSVSDLSAFYRCSFVGYQDTLYVHSFRQFYRECEIHGTIDFICGDAAVVFQSCNIFARRPMEGQDIIIAAQARVDPNENTGISIQYCSITAAPDLAANKSLFRTYLGRPWREYSRTVYMKSYLEDIISPAGWTEWSGDFALSTLYFGEYVNKGPGAGTSERVEWPGYHIMSFNDALNFSVANLIAGDLWLHNVPFIAGIV